jgi:hypothetical protein
MDKAHDLVKEWNNRNMISQVVQVNIPQVWAGSAGYLQGKRLLQEPFIENYQKFNSNTGWADTDTPWPRVMQALSRFSYHVSGGQFVLCDLQGGVYSDTVVLTDPVILSRSKQYGVTDLGPLGISSFSLIMFAMSFAAQIGQGLLIRGATIYLSQGRVWLWLGVELRS